MTTMYNPNKSPRSKSLDLLRSLSSEHISTFKTKEQDTSCETIKMGNILGATQGEECSSKRDVESDSRQSRGSSGRNRRNESSADNFEDDPKDVKDDVYYSLEDLVDQKIYKLRQECAPFSKLFSWAQFFVLIAMMVQCKVAPLNINPMIGPYPDALDYWGGKNAYKILNEGEYYRLVTPIMLHAGILHLVGNVAVQLDQGAFYEKEWGSGVWLIIYISSAVGSSILSCCFLPNNISVGSSGAVMGLFGGKLAEVFCRACESANSEQGRVGHFVRKEQCTESMCAVTIVMLFSFVPFVDWSAHLGGVIAGFCSGIICFSCYIQNKLFLVFWFLVGVGITAIYYGGTITYMLNEVEPMDDLDDVCGYYQQFFEDYECNCQLED